MKHYIYNIGIILLVLSYASLVSAPEAVAQDDLRFKTIVIDAGHGGKDPGAISKDRTTNEKDVNLAVALKLGKLINENCPDVKVEYTRTTDIYVTLDGRAKIANKHKANLFLSIHVNAHDNSAASGFSCHILGQSSKKGSDTFAYNLNVCKRENSVILLEDDYSTKYQGFDPTDPESFIFFNLMQNAFYEQSLNFAVMVNEKMDKIGPVKGNRGISQDPFYVLWKTTMPAMLFEMAFISNSADLAVITTDEGKDKIANALYEAFLQFKTDYNKSLNYNEPTTSVSTVSEESTKEENKVEMAVEESVRYGIQVSTVARQVSLKDPFFKGYKASCYPSGKVYKYIIGESSEKADVENIFDKAAEKFPGCFMVKIEGDSVSRISR